MNIGELLQGIKIPEVCISIRENKKCGMGNSCIYLYHNEHDHRVYVCPLPENDKFCFKQFMSKYGPVYKTITLQKKTKIGFAHFTSPNDANRAICVLNGTVLCGKRMVCKLARERRSESHEAHSHEAYSHTHEAYSPRFPSYDGKAIN